MANPTTSLQLRPKSYTTAPESLHLMHRPSKISHNYIKMYKPSNLVQQTPSWSPINQDYYLQEKTLPNTPAAPFQVMQDWLHNQRQAAAASRSSSSNAIEAFLPSPPPPPPQQYTDTQRPLRLAKVAALAALITRPSPVKPTITIPQLEGAEPTPDTTLSFSSPHHPLSPKIPWSPMPSSSPSSLQWDLYMTVHPIDIYSDTSSNTTTSPSFYIPLWKDSHTKPPGLIWGIFGAKIVDIRHIHYFVAMSLPN
jgi:hypothetical protein